MSDTRDFRATVLTAAGRAVALLRVTANEFEDGGVTWDAMAADHSNPDLRLAWANKAAGCRAQASHFRKVADDLVQALSGRRTSQTESKS